MDKIQAFGKNINASFTPFAQRTQQYVREQLGQADEKTELPPDYIELEKRVDALKAVHTKLLSATSQYTNEAYDYPPNVRESFVDLSRTVSDKVKLLSNANSAAEAQAAFTAPPSAKPQPKTFSHAIARACLAGSQQLAQSDVRGSGDDHLATALEKYAVASEKVGEARLTQDEAIQHKYLSPWTTTLNTELQAAARARKHVETLRLGLDSVKARAKTRFGPGNEHQYDEKTRTDIEKAEDDFVSAVEQASDVMRNTLGTPEPLRNLVELVKAQEEYHQQAQNILKEALGEVEALQGEQEESYRKGRQGAQ